MAEEKKFDESSFAMVVKELNAVGEMIRTKQEEKQAVMNEFEKEKGRYHGGEISEKALASSVKKTNNELKKIDKDMKNTIQKAERIVRDAKKMVAKQSPKHFKAKLGGIRLVAHNKDKKKR